MGELANLRPDYSDDSAKDPVREDVLQTLGEDLKTKLKTAVEGRRAAGIDQRFQDDQDRYDGIDSVNRSSHVRKAHSLAGPLILKDRAPDDDSRSSIFMNITRPFTNSAASKVAEMTLPPGDLPGKLLPTARSDTELLQDIITLYPEAGASLPLFPDLMAKIQLSPEETQARVDKSNLIVKDWMQECHWKREAQKTIDEAARLGCSVMKGPFPQRKHVSRDVPAFLQTLPQALRLQVQMRLLYQPGSEWLSVRNFYPDPACGTDINNGGYVFEYSTKAKRKLRDLKKDPTYLADQIDACLQEAPKMYDGSFKEKRGKAESAKSSEYDIWIMTGHIIKDALKLVEGADEIEEETFFATVHFCNDRVIKVAEYPLEEDEDFPYDVLCWEEKPDCWTGDGVSFGIDAPQRMLNAGVRNLLDNAALSSGPQIIYFEDLIEPVDGVYKISPRKVWKALIGDSLDAMQQVSQAFMTINIPSMQAELMAIIDKSLKFAEDTTGLPMILQGQTSESNQKVGVTQMMSNNATTVLRNLVNQFDQRIVTPQFARYGAWVWVLGPEDARTDYKVQALGSSTLIIRDMQTQALIQLLEKVLDDRYGLSPKKVMAAILKGQQFDPDQLSLDEVEKQTLQEARESPEIQQIVAEIKAAADREIAAQKAEIEMMKIQASAGEKTETNRTLARNETLRAEKDLAIAGIEAETNAVKTQTQAETQRAGQAEKPREPNADDVLSSVGL